VAAYLYQAAASASDANKLTLSAWVKVLTTNAPSESGDTYPLFCFGDSSIALVTNSTMPRGATIRVELYGEVDSIDGNDICTTDNLEQSAGDWLQYRPGVNPVPESAGGNPWWSISNDGLGGNKFSPKIMARTTGNMNTKVTPGKWFHLMIAVDTSAGLSYGSPFHKVAVKVNGEAYTDLSGPSDGVHNPTYMDSNCPSTLYGGIGAGSFFFGPFVASSSSTGGTTNGIIPGYNFVLSGKEVGLPSYPDSAWGLNTQIVDMAQVQIWVGTYIDPTNATNFSKFVTLNGHGGGTSVAPEIAAEYFGTPTYLFKGARDEFVINHGTGGAFSAAGTINSTTFSGF
jgi:hypothetical protein